MLKQILKQISLHFYPPKTGDVYLGDQETFFAHKGIEKVLHGMVDLNGQSIWDAMPSKNSYKITITSDMMPYYICKGEVLAVHKTQLSKSWLVRTQPRRLGKKFVKELILKGFLVKL